MSFYYEKCFLCKSIQAIQEHERQFFSTHKNY